MKLIERLRERLREPRFRRRGLVMADQAASSLSNVLVSVLVARSFDSPEPFGAFGLAMIIYQLIVGGSKSVIGHTLLSVYSPLDPESRRKVVPDLQGATLSISVTASVVLAAVSAVVGGVAGQAILALAVVLPVVLLQDTWRFALVVDRPVATLMIDLVWLVAVVIAFWFAPPNAEVGWYIVVWGLSGGVSACVAIVVGGGFVGHLRPFKWIMDHREVGFRYLGEYFSAQAVGHIVVTSVGAIAGIGTLGSVRGSQVYYGPHNTLHQGIYMAVVPEGAQSRDDPVRLRRIMLVVSFGLATLSALWMCIGLLLPASWGKALLGSVWPGAHEIMVPMGIAMIAAGASSGGLLGLRSLADAKQSLKARLWITPWLLFCPLAGTVVGGAGGFAVGYAMARVVGAFIWWRALNRALNEGIRSPLPSVYSGAGVSSDLRSNLSLVERS